MGSVTLGFFLPTFLLSNSWRGRGPGGRGREGPHAHHGPARALHKAPEALAGRHRPRPKETVPAAPTGHTRASGPAEGPAGVLQVPLFPEQAVGRRCQAGVAGGQAVGGQGRLEGEALVWGGGRGQTRDVGDVV